MVLLYPWMRTICSSERCFVLTHSLLLPCYFIRYVFWCIVMYVAHASTAVLHHILSACNNSPMSMTRGYQHQSVTWSHFYYKHLHSRPVPQTASPLPLWYAPLCDVIAVDTLKRVTWTFPSPGPPPPSPAAAKAGAAEQEQQKQEQTDAQAMQSSSIGSSSRAGAYFVSYYCTTSKC